MQTKKAIAAATVAALAGLLLMQVTRTPDPVAPPPSVPAPAPAEPVAALPAPVPSAPDDAQVTDAEPPAAAEPEASSPHAAAPRPKQRLGRRVEDLDEQTLQTRKIVSRSAKNWSWIRHRLSGAGQDAYPLRNEAIVLLGDLRDAMSDMDYADLQGLQQRSEQLAAKVAASPWVDDEIKNSLQDLQENAIPFNP